LQGEQAAQAGSYPQAEAMWAMASLIAQGFAAKDPRFAFSLDNLGQVLARQGKFPLAEYVLGRAWQTKTQGNVSQIEAARTLNIVSELYFYQKRFEESEQLISRVLTVYQAIYGQDHSHTAEVARNLSMIQQARMAYQAANPTASSAYNPAVPSTPPSQSLQPEAQPQAAYAGAQTGANPATASYTAAPAIPSPNPNPGKVGILGRRVELKNKCELCGYEIDGEWCGRCTGTSLKAISPENRLK
jgi:tetratricopeptide (TPR) repeat protein